MLAALRQTCHIGPLDVGGVQVPLAHSSSEQTAEVSIAIRSVDQVRSHVLFSAGQEVACESICA